MVLGIYTLRYVKYLLHILFVAGTAKSPLILKLFFFLKVLLKVIQGNFNFLLF